MSESRPRTLADQLRGWPDERLAGLLAARPDLAQPAPQDSGQLAARLATRSSVARALDGLTHLELVVLDAAAGAGGPVAAEALHERVHAGTGAVDVALDRLTGLALLWGDRSALRPLSVLADVLGPVSGLGPGAATLLGRYGPSRMADLARDLGLPPSGDRHSDVLAVAAHLAEPAAVTELLGEVDDRARAILDRLDREGKDGSVESTDRAVRRGEEAGPVDQLLSRGLLVARDRRHVAVPREVGLVLRGGRTTREPADVPPEPATSDRSPVLVERAAAGAAFEAVRHVELLLEHWGTSPAPALRSGGLGVREVKATSELLGVQAPVAALLAEVASAAGLLATAPTEDEDAAWMPTDAFDAWMTASTADRWSRLALAWLDSPRLVGLVGSRRDGKPVNALAPGLERAWVADTRRTTLAELAALPDGQVLAAGTGVPSLVARLAWLRPRRPAARAEVVAWTVEEAAALGVAALGGVPPHGRALLEEDPAHRAPGLLEPLLPDPVDHVLLQADLTAVAPGPLTQELAHQLAVVADVESRGGATVYRFSDASVRRAFDAGWTSAELSAFLAAASRTPVPQGLDYLVQDVARRFGTVRAGAAESFLRSDDEAALAELVHHPKAASLRLRRIAPTVVVSDVPLDVLLPRLRELGSSPVVEAPDGTVRLARRDVQRARQPRPRRHPDHPDHPDPAPAHGARARARSAARVAATVTAIRAGDRAAASRPASPTSVAGSPAATLAVLREAARDRRSVWIGYVDGDGATAERVVDPVRVEGGRLSAYDHRTEDVRTFAVHRITAARPVDPGG